MYIICLGKETARLLRGENLEANRHRFPIDTKTLLSTLPVRRLGEPEDIANACAWLISEDSGYVTGQTIGVNGGRVVT